MQAIAVFRMVDCRTLAQRTLCGNEELDEYEVRCFLSMLDFWRHTTVIPQTDQEPRDRG